MKDISISAHTVASAIAVSGLYAVSIYFLWSSEMSFAFQIDPAQSKFTRALAKLMDRDYAKMIGISSAFISVHIIWGMRHALGHKLMKTRFKSAIGPRPTSSEEGFNTDKLAQFARAKPIKQADEKVPVEKPKDTLKLPK